MRVFPDYTPNPSRNNTIAARLMEKLEEGFGREPDERNLKS